MQWMKNAWHGETRLWKAFWVYGVVFSAIFGVVLGIIVAVGFGALTIAQGASNSSAPFWLVYVMTAIPFIYPIWALIVIWKCAFNTSLKLWGYLARIIVLLGFGIVGWNVYWIAFAGYSVGDYSQDLSKTMGCIKELQDSATKQGADPKAYVQQHKDELMACQRSKQVGAAGAASVMKSEGILVVSPTSPSDQICLQTMTDTAKKSGIDPQKYIADNQAYLNDCVKYYTDHPQPANTKTP